MMPGISSFSARRAIRSMLVIGATLQRLAAIQPELSRQESLGCLHHHRKGDRDQDQRVVDRDGQRELARHPRWRRARSDYEQHVRPSVVGRAHPLVQSAQSLLQQRLIRLQLDGQTVTGRGQARLALRLVNEPRQIVRQRALVAVLERVDRRIVDALNRIAVELFEAGARAALACVTLDLRATSLPRNSAITASRSCVCLIATRALSYSSMDRKLSAMFVVSMTFS